MHRIELHGEVGVYLLLAFEELDEMLTIAKHGLRELFDIQKAALA